MTRVRRDRECPTDLIVIGHRQDVKPSGGPSHQCLGRLGAVAPVGMDVEIRSTSWHGHLGPHPRARSARSRREQRELVMRAGPHDPQTGLRVFRDTSE
jgi:hypothetical protein